MVFENNNATGLIGFDMGVGQAGCMPRTPVGLVKHPEERISAKNTGTTVLARLNKTVLARLNTPVYSVSEVAFAV